MEIIVTRAGVPILVDAADFSRLSQYTWTAVRVGSRGKFYAYANIDGQQVSMHRLVLGLEFGDDRQADHINGATLDNRRENLRVVSAKQNCWNRVFHKNNASGFRGVCFHSRIGKWQARIYRDGKRVSLGYFDDAESASTAYSIAFSEIQKEVYDVSA